MNLMSHYVRIISPPGKTRQWVVVDREVAIVGSADINDPSKRSVRCAHELPAQTMQAASLENTRIHHPSPYHRLHSVPRPVRAHSARYTCSLQEVDNSLSAIKAIAHPVSPNGWVRFHLQVAIKHRDAAESHVNVAKEHQQAVENHGYTDDPKGQAAAAQLSQVKGYITLLPIHWTEGENNNMSFHTAAITKNNQVNPSTEMMAHSEQSSGEKPT